MTVGIWVDVTDLLKDCTHLGRIRQGKGGNHVLIADLIAFRLGTKTAGDALDIEYANIGRQDGIHGFSGGGQRLFIASGQFNLGTADLGTGVNALVGPSRRGPTVFVGVSEIGIGEQVGFVEGQFDFSLESALIFIDLKARVIGAQVGNQEGDFAFDSFGSG